jgi:hypothetical protein
MYAYGDHDEGAGIAGRGAAEDWYGGAMVGGVGK